jgi:hypothetical protein
MKLAEIQALMIEVVSRWAAKWPNQSRFAEENKIDDLMLIYLER